MKRGSSVLQPPSDEAKRHTPLHHGAGGGGDAACSSLSSSSVADTDAAGSSPFPAATSLFSPDVTTKMASDLLIRLSEATQKAQVHPGSRVEAEPRCGRQQDEPGLALSPDGPGASPEPPSLTHTPDGNAATAAVATDTLASDLLRKLAERQEVNCHGVRVKEEEEPMEVDTLAVSDLIHDRPTTSSPATASRHLYAIKTEEQGDNAVGAKMAERRLLGLKIDDSFFAAGCPSGAVNNTFQFRVKMEDNNEGSSVSGTKMADQLLPGSKMDDQFLFKAKLSERPSGRFLTAVKMEETENQLLANAVTTEHVFPRVKTEEQLYFGAKMEEQCLRAALWQDMSVNLASTLLHQLSERVSKSNSQLTDRSTPPTVRSSPVLKVNVDSLRLSSHLSSQDPPHEIQTSLSRDQTTGCSYFYRCHVCGFETDGHALFQSHMTEHRQWERGSFSLHCCLCDHSTNEEAEMRAHVDTHVHGDSGLGDLRCPVTSPPLPPPTAAASSSSSALSVSVATQPPPAEEEEKHHRCRICQRSFPGQQELLVHFQGHRQGNQYRCDRCGHLTRTANKLVEHVRVHTGERPFTCHLCPYSAKRRDSLRLHCKVKHGGNGGGATAGAGGGATVADVHTHRSYAHADNQRSHKHVQRLHTPLRSLTSSSLPPLHPSLSDRTGWRDLSPLLPITTLISLKPRPLSSSSSPSSSSSSSKQSFLCYLGLTTSL